MFERILKRMREKIRQRQYVMTLHAEEEMNDDDLTIYDVERGILTVRYWNARKTERPLNGSTGSPRGSS